MAEGQMEDGTILHGLSWR